MARKVTIEQPTSATWAADATTVTALERVGLPYCIDLACEITPSATMTAANQPDGLFRLIQNLRIVGSQKSYFNLPGDDGAQGGVLLHYLNRVDGHGLGHADGAITAPSLTFTSVNYVYHCGVRPRDKYNRDNAWDLSGFIPAFAESQLQSEWVTSGNDVMDDTVTISSAVMRFILHRVLGTEAELLAEMENQELSLPPGARGMVPSWSATVHALAGSTTDFDAEQIDIPVGAYLARIAAVAQDATTVRTLRAEDEVTRLAIRVPKTNEDFFKSRTQYLTGHLEYGSVLTADSGAAVNAAVATPVGADFNNAVPKGIYIIDIRPRAFSKAGRDYGWDLRQEQLATYKLGLFNNTRADGDDLLVIWERYQTYDGPLA